MDILNGLTALLVGLLGCGSVTGVVAYLLHRNAERRIKNAEARAQEAQALLAEANVDKARWDRYEKQLDHAARTIELLHSQIETDAKRDADNNREINDKTVRIRELTDKMLQTEGLLNDINRKVARLTEERDLERLLKERYKGWHCRSSICREGNPDPKGRRPPNPRILGKKFTIRDITEGATASDDRKTVDDTQPSKDTVQ